MQRIGIIGAGQLGQMLGFAGSELGIDCQFLDPAKNPPAAQAGKVLRYPFDSAEGLAELAAGCDVLTYEFENVPVAAVDQIAATTPVYPPPNALRLAQDRLREKNLFTNLGIPFPGFETVDSKTDIPRAASNLGYPIVLKTRRLGYDGKGQELVRDEADFQSAFTALGGKDLIAEEWIQFNYEVSAIGARNEAGDIAIYPLTENKHDRGILSVSRAPVTNKALAPAAEGYLRVLLENLDYVGVLALELFVVGDRLLANEFAPRVHNSGHWTIEGARTSQFENHLRAIAGLPLGPTDMQGTAGMLNLIGTMPCNLDEIDATTCFVHDYGKSPRPGRKLGHITVVAEDESGRDEALIRLGKLLIS